MIDEIVADGAVLTIHGKKPHKPPLEYDLKRLALRSAGPNTGMTFESSLTDAKPPGEIETKGTFGPLDRDEPGATPVSGDYTFQNADLSVFERRFALKNGVMTLNSLKFRLPGLSLSLNGTYELEGGQIDFRGTAAMDAKLSQTTTGFKSLLLKAVDPFFKKGTNGAVLPIKITGTRDAPSFSPDIDIKRRLKFWK